MESFPVPEATANPTQHADWLELTAVYQSTHSASVQDLASAVRRTGSVDATIDADLEDNSSLDIAAERENELLESIAEAAFDILEARRAFLGNGYPFNIGNVLEARKDALDSPYLFLSALTAYRYVPGTFSQTGSTLFELLCTHALYEYLGGNPTAESMHFGYPRPAGPSGFPEAVNELCRRLGDGIQCKTSDLARSQNDGKLDVVAWVSFGDSRSSQISVFGQCATGLHWQTKINDLQPYDFCSQWLAKVPTPIPLAAFFVPGQIPETDWTDLTHSRERLLFDRLRIARLLEGLNDDIRLNCAEWALQALTQA